MNTSTSNRLPLEAGIWWEKARSSLWLLPCAMLLAGVALFWLAQWVDTRRLPEELLSTGWLLSGTGGDARNLLSTLVTTIITMSSVVFSMTIVTLTLAASQFGSRLVRSYLKDLRTRGALGMFLTTVLYCLLALRVVSEEMRAPEVPHVTVSVGLAMAMLCVIALLFFLNAVARSIIADEVVRRVARDLEDSIACLPPREDGETRSLPRPRHLAAGRDGRLLRARREGYIQAIDYEALAEAATGADIELHLQVMPGDYMCRGGWLGMAWPPERCPDEVVRALRRCVLIGSVRTPVQDLRFSIRHLVDVALRALSPGINDANTALVVIDRLRGSMAELMGKSLPTGVFCDEAGRVRLVGERLSHAQLLDSAFHQIRESAAPHSAVVVALLHAFERLAEHADDAELRAALVEQAELAARAFLEERPRDRGQHEAVEERLAAVRTKVELVAQALRHPGRVPAAAERSGTQAAGVVGT
ncbi:DUF2254 domain-containing protein [Ramlibacter sp. AN1015]|uniref:DUF2254 domain-containing protein n=1 Tax=Ramlibacter sp. AN1015 TaxID=3133428 RepID=UPI0030BD2AAE